MKHILLLLLFPFLGLSQVQIGEDINGEADNELSGVSVSLSSDGSIIAIGAFRNSNSNGYESGAVRIYENQSDSWIKIGNDIIGETERELFGRSVSLNSNGSIVAIGAHLNDDNGLYSGQVRVYENQSNVWMQIGQDINGDTNNLLGRYVSLSGNGNVLAVGCPFWVNAGNILNSGFVRVFKKESDVWVQIGNDIIGETEFFFISTMSLSNNGEVLGIRFIYDNFSDNIPGFSFVRIYKNQSDSWVQIGGDINGESEGDDFGFSISLSNNGNIVAIGAPGNDGNGNRSGHVRIYENQSDSWVQIGGDINGEAIENLSGWSISLSNNGNIVAIGAPDNNGSGEFSGHIRVYENQSDNWVQIGNDIDGESESDGFGDSVSISADGTIVAIGGPGNGDNGIYSGHVRVFDLTEALSIEENNTIDFNLYPNPATSSFSIELPNNLELKSVVVYNSLGQLIKTSSQKIINTSNLASGVYVVEVATNKGKTSKKLIIE